MSGKLAKIGIVVTILYAIIFFWGFGDLLTDVKSLKLNEVGDFFAGVFGPLAILWLILGFFQQGTELRQNNDALKMQAQELKNSVEQQMELVKVAKESNAVTLEQVHYERLQEVKKTFPRFVVQAGGSMASGGEVTYRLTMQNHGATAYNVVLTSSESISIQGQSIFATCLSQCINELSIVHKTKNIADRENIYIQYETDRGDVGKKEFVVIREMGSEGKSSVTKVIDVNPTKRNDLVT